MKWSVSPSQGIRLQEKGRGLEGQTLILGKVFQIVLGKTFRMCTVLLLQSNDVLLVLKTGERKLYFQCR